MKAVLPFLPVIAFAAGTSVAVSWNTHEDAATVVPAVAARPAASVVSANSPTPAPAAGKVADMALTARPSVDDLFEAVGLDRVVLMGRFLQTATSAELQQIFARNREQGGQEVVFMGLAALRWIELDPDAALKIPTPSTVWWAFAKLNPEAAFAAAQDRDDATIQQVLYSIAQYDAPLVRRLLGDHPDMETKYLWEGITAQMLGSAPQEALGLALEKGIPLTDLADYWAEADPVAALAYAVEIEKPAARSEFLAGAFARLTSAEPAAAFREAGKLPPGPVRSHYLTNALAALSRENPDAARAAIQSLAPGPDREVALTSLAAALSDRDEASAVALLATIRWDGIRGPAPARGSSNTLTDTGYSPARAVVPAIQQLMTVAPLATANTLAALPPGSGIPLAPASQRWAALQPEAASAWVKQQNPGPARDEAIRGLNEWLTHVSPEPDFEAALTWAAAATPERRFSLYRQAIADWKREDRSAALAAAAKLPLQENDRARLLQFFD